MITLNATKLKEMFIAGGKTLAKEYEYINQLNVFPVPDGDTGTNMMITINGAIDSIINVDYTDIQLLGKQFSRGLLMNARGNSGVIFSQIIKGLVSVFKEGRNQIGIIDLVNAFTAAKNTAYAAVVTPKEGTILTVIRVTAEALAKRRNFKSIEEVMYVACEEARKILAETPNMLYELKEVGVVDSGGYGLCCFFDGMLLAINKKQPDQYVKKIPIANIEDRKSFIDKLEDSNVGFGYCCEFIMALKSRVSLEQSNKKDFDKAYFKKELSKIGNSIAIVVDGDIVKLHVHTLTPHAVLEIGAQYGEFNRVKIENMTLQFIERNPGTALEKLEKQIKQKKRLPFEPKIIATVPSVALAKIYLDDFNITNTIVTEIVGNPSVQEFMDKIRDANTSNIIIILDNINYALAANETKALVGSDINIEIINFNNIVFSYLACLSFDNVKNFEENVNNINKNTKNLVVAKISISSKDIQYSQIDVKRNHFIGIIDKKIVASSDNMNKTLETTSETLLSKIKRPKKAYIIYGKEAQKRDIRSLEKYLMEKFSLKVTLINGNQSTYFFYIGIQK